MKSSKKENKAKYPKWVCWFCLISIISLALSVSTFYMNSNLIWNVEIVSVSIVLAFVGILATFIVVSNYSQVKNIESNFDKKVKNLELTFSNKIKDFQDKTVEFMADSKLMKSIADMSINENVNELSKIYYKEKGEQMNELFSLVYHIAYQNKDNKENLEKILNKIPLSRDIIIQMLNDPNSLSL